MDTFVRYTILLSLLTDPGIIGFLETVTSLMLHDTTIVTILTSVLNDLVLTNQHYQLSHLKDPESVARISASTLFEDHQSFDQAILNHIFYASWIVFRPINVYQLMVSIQHTNCTQRTYIFEGIKFLQLVNQLRDKHNLPSVHLPSNIIDSPQSLTHVLTCFLETCSYILQVNLPHLSSTVSATSFDDNFHLTDSDTQEYETVMTLAAINLPQLIGLNSLHTATLFQPIKCERLQLHWLTLSPHSVRNHRTHELCFTSTYLVNSPDIPTPSRLTMQNYPTSTTSPHQLWNRTPLEIEQQIQSEYLNSCINQQCSARTYADNLEVQRNPSYGYIPLICNTSALNDSKFRINLTAILVLPTSDLTHINQDDNGCSFHTTFHTLTPLCQKHLISYPTCVFDNVSFDHFKTTSVKYDRFDKNNIAHHIAKHLSTRYQCSSPTHLWTRNPPVSTLLL